MTFKKEIEEIEDIRSMIKENDGTFNGNMSLMLAVSDAYPERARRAHEYAFSELMKAGGIEE